MVLFSRACVAAIAFVTMGCGGKIAPSDPLADAEADDASLGEDDATTIDAALTDAGETSDVSLPPITFQIVSLAGAGVSGDITALSVPVPTPVTDPIDGVTYSFTLRSTASYVLSLEWKDTANGNDGWTASFGGVPGGNLPWPLMFETTDTPTAPFDDHLTVSLVGTAGATENTLILTVRSHDDPNRDFGILNQIIRPAP